jgi:hypothetical protein
MIDVSPAHAQVSGDWWGPTVGGTLNTWHWGGNAQVTSSTAFDATCLHATADGTFAHSLTTTAQFVDPRPSTYTPSSAANYKCYFEIDQSAHYSVGVDLARSSVVRLFRFGTGYLINEFNTSLSPPRRFEATGMLAPGSYLIEANSSIAAANLPNGINFYSRSGSYSNYSFFVQVPEPRAVMLASDGALVAIQRRKR